MLDKRRPRRMNNTLASLAESTDAVNEESTTAVTNATGSNLDTGNAMDVDMQADLQSPAYWKREIKRLSDEIKTLHAQLPSLQGADRHNANLALQSLKDQRENAAIQFGNITGGDVTRFNKFIDDDESSGGNTGLFLIAALAGFFFLTRKKRRK